MELLLSQFQLHGTKTGLKEHINNQNSSYPNNSVADAVAYLFVYVLLDV